MWWCSAACACCQKRSRRCRLHCSEAENGLARHALLDLLESPAPTKGRVELFTALSAYWLLAGNAFLVKLGPSNGPPRELWPLRPDRLRIKASGSEIPAAYEYSIEGQVQSAVSG